MRSIWFTHSLRAVLGTALLTALGTPIAAKPYRPGRPGAINLFAAAGLLIEVNRQQCGITNSGKVCSSFSGSPVGGGGFWPKGTPDQYIFNSGLQLGAVVDAAAVFGGPGRSWAGDTIGAYLFDARGGQEHGAGISLVYNRLNPADAAAWPASAHIVDPAIYNPVLLTTPRLPSASQGDAWVRYWEGDPAASTGRLHPMGILVDQRALAWNYPTGNEDIIYFVFTFYNVTARDRSVYTSSTTIPAELRDSIADIGARFQDLNENAFKVDIPDAGYTIRNMHAAFAMDADVARFEQNYSTAILPFNIGTIFTGTWLPDAGWIFPADIFGPPFAAAPGFIGVKFLRAPSPLGLTMFSQTFNPNQGFGLLDPDGVNQLYRYLSGSLGPSDNPCSVGDTTTAKRLRICFLGSVQGDARFYQASGPFDMAPGEARNIVVAYIQAAPVATPDLVIGTDFGFPGLPLTGDSIAAVGNAGVRPIERIAGWVSQTDINSNNSIEQTEVATVPRSLLNKALVAQNVFDNGFLLPFAPDAPNFYLVPGDNQVTVTWEKSRSETTGDPYFAVASARTTGTGDPNPLYDPNFRQFDVAGYRIYRGRTSSQLQLVAQFDFTGPQDVIVDYTGRFDYGNACAPELGVNGTPGCPVTFDTVPSPIVPTSPHVEHPLVGDIIQIKAGDRFVLNNGSVLIVRADTTVINTQCANVKCPALADNGVPFVYIDRDVRNSFTYFYTVTAFDVNSTFSTPTSLESPRVTKPVTPRKPAANVALAQLSFSVSGDDGVPLDPNRTWDINPTTGRFTGPPPPTAVSQLAGVILAGHQLMPVLAPGEVVMTIDSVRGRTSEDFPCDVLGLENIQGICFEFFGTFARGASRTVFRSPVPWPIWEGFGEADSMQAVIGAFTIAGDVQSAASFGIPSGVPGAVIAGFPTFKTYIRYSAHEGQGGRRFGGGISPGGSRWFDGADETLDHPTYSLRVGRVAGVDTIYAPLSHLDVDPTTAGVQNYTQPFADSVGGGNTIRTNMQCFSYVVAAMGRQADIEMTWGAGGTIASVRDITHKVDVPFRTVPDGSYGFIGDANGNGKIDWTDFDFLEGVAQSDAHLGFCIGPDPGAGSRALLVPQPVIMAVSTAGQPDAADLSFAGMPTTGTGFGIYINGQRFIFQLTGGTPPTTGTKWTLRSYAGFVTASTGGGTTTPSGYSYAAIPASPAIPGLRVSFVVQERTTAAAERSDILDRVHTVPDPYYVANAMEITPNSKVLKFVNLPPQAIIRIYSVSGVLVSVIAHDDPGLGGEATWNLRNRNNQFVASGVYFYHVETPQGHTKVGRFTVINFAP